MLRERRCEIACLLSTDNLPEFMLSVKSTYHFVHLTDGDAIS